MQLQIVLWATFVVGATSCRSVKDGGQINYWDDGFECWRCSCPTNKTGVLQVSSFGLIDQTLSLRTIGNFSRFSRRNAPPRFYSFREHLDISISNSYGNHYGSFRAVCECGESDCHSDAECGPNLVCSHNVGWKYGLAANIATCDFPRGYECVRVKDQSSIRFWVDQEEVEDDGEHVHPPTDGEQEGHIQACWDLPACPFGGVLRRGAFDIYPGDVLSIGEANYNYLPLNVAFEPSEVVRFVTNLTNSAHFEYDVVCGCSVENPCGEGEGDCDSDAACEPGLVCSHNVGWKYGLAANVDACETKDAEKCLKKGAYSTISFRREEEEEGEQLEACWIVVCSVGGILEEIRANFPYGSILSVGKANYTYSSAPFKVPIETPEEVVRFVSHGHSDSSEPTVLKYQVHCNPTCSETTSAMNGTYSFCSGCKCQEGEGDCDNDSDCFGNLVCSYDVGSQYGFDDGVDVCELPENVKEGRTGCLEVGNGTDINYYLSSNESVVDLCWRTSCYGFLIPLAGSQFGSGMEFTIAGRRYNKMPEEPVPIRTGDEVYFVSKGSSTQPVGFLFDVNCTLPAQCSVVGDGEEIYITVVDNADKIYECWTVACDASGVLQFSSFDLLNPGDDLRFLQDGVATRYTSSAHPPFPFRGPLDVYFTSDVQLGPRRGFRASVKCYKSCENPFLDKKAGNQDACTVECPCKEGEGDCDRDAECEPGLVCSHNVGLKYGAAAELDVCENTSSSAVTAAVTTVPSMTTSSSEAPNVHPVKPSDSGDPDPVFVVALTAGLTAPLLCLLVAFTIFYLGKRKARRNLHTAQPELLEHLGEARDMDIVDETVLH